MLTQQIHARVYAVEHDGWKYFVIRFIPLLGQQSTWNNDQAYEALAAYYVSIYQCHIHDLGMLWKSSFYNVLWNISSTALITNNRQWPDIESDSDI